MPRTRHSGNWENVRATDPPYEQVKIAIVIFNGVGFVPERL
jgi:hypothetical protein